MELDVHMPWSWWWTIPADKLVTQDPDVEDELSTDRWPPEARHLNWGGIARTVRRAVHQVVWSPETGMVDVVTVSVDAELPVEEERIVRAWLGHGGEPVMGDLYEDGELTREICNGRHRLWYAQKADLGPWPVQSKFLVEIAGAITGEWVDAPTGQIKADLNVLLRRRRQHRYPWHLPGTRARRAALAARYLNGQHERSIRECSEMLP